MCTYEHLVEVTLAHGRIPLVVPQLRTITLGGAVTGLGIESTSFRSGLPHESVLEMDVMTGSGEIVTTKPGDELFDAFPNSYGSLGYATRLRIELEPVPPYVALRHVRFDDAEALADGRRAHHRRARVGGGAGRRPRRRRVRPRRALPHPRPLDRRARPDQRLRRPAGLLPLPPAARDRPAHRCSTTSGAGTPTGSGARVPSAPSTRSYDACGRAACAAPTSTGSSSPSTAASASATASTGAPGAPQGERVVQDVEVPVAALAGVPRLVRPRGRHAPGVAVPAAAARGGEGRGDDRPWPGYPLTAATTYVNVGFWGVVNVGPEAPQLPAQPRDRGEGLRARRPQEPLLRGVLRARGVRPPLRRRQPGPRQGPPRPRRPT